MPEGNDDNDGGKLEKRDRDLRMDSGDSGYCEGLPQGTVCAGKPEVRLINSWKSWRDARTYRRPLRGWYQTAGRVRAVQLLSQGAIYMGASRPGPMESWKIGMTEQRGDGVFEQMEYWSIG